MTTTMDPNTNRRVLYTYASRPDYENLLNLCRTPGSNVEIPKEIIPVIAERLISALVKIEREDHIFKVQPTKDAEPFMVTDRQFKLLTITGTNITDSDPKRHTQDDYRTTGITGLMCRIFDIVGPMVGAPASMWVYQGTDVYPGTVVKVSPSGKTIWVADDHATRTDKNGQSESQTYTYERQEDPNPREFHLGRGKKNAGRWCCDGYRAAVGHRRKYDDPSF